MGVLIKGNFLEPPLFVTGITFIILFIFAGQVLFSWHNREHSIMDNVVGVGLFLALCVGGGMREIIKCDCKMRNK